LANAGETLATNITATRVTIARTLIIRLISYLLVLRTPGVIFILTIADRITWRSMAVQFVHQYLSRVPE